MYETMMEERHRNIIQSNIDKLVEATDYKVLVKKCIEKNIINDKMRQLFERKVNDVEELAHKALFEKITTRSATAFDKLVEICKENFERAVYVLEPSTEKDNIQLHTKGQLAPLSSDEIDELHQYVEIDKPDDNTDPCKYSIYYNVEYAGVLFFVNYTEDRPKAKEERDWILSLFNQLNFRIFYLENKSVESIHAHIFTLKAKYLRNVNCFFYIHLGTGTLNDVYFNDNIAIKVFTIVDTFNNKNCGDLLDKQKVFIFPSVNSDYVTKSPNKIQFEFGVHKEGTNTRKVILPQNVSTRSSNLYFYLEKDDNSFLHSIKIFCQKVAKYAYREPFQNILKLYFNERKRAEHSDYREVVDEGCRSQFEIPNLDLIKKYGASRPEFAES